MRLLLFFILFFLPIRSFSQDSVRINYADFIQKAVEYSPLLKSHQSKFNTALSKVAEVDANRFLPRFEISSNHGLMPTVTSPKGLPRDQWHLDPNLENDFEHWSVFTKVDFSAVQPLYTWGALTNAVNASKSAADVVHFQVEMKEKDQKIQLTKLYFSLVLARNLHQLSTETIEKFDKAEKKLEELGDDAEIEEKELFKFKISKQQFLIKSDEVEENKRFVEHAFNLALGTNNVVYLPTTDSLNLINGIQPLSLFEQEAVQNRVELKAVKAAQKAVNFGIEAQKALRLPMIYFGFGGEYVHTPRPVQAQPFIGTRFDYLNLVYSFGFKQSLNFGVMNSKIAQIESQRKEAEFTMEAVGQGILLEVAEAYKGYLLALSKKEKLASALQTSKEWLRKEQIDYDLGFGEIKNLVEAMKMNIELDAEFKQSVFDFTVKETMLLKASGQLN